MRIDYRKTRVLIVDDDKSMVELIEQVFVQQGVSTCTAPDGENGIELFKKHMPHIVLTDIGLPGISGIELLKTIKHLSPITQVIVVSGVGTTKDVIEALRLGACDYLTKPLNTGILIHTVNRCLERYELIKERIEQKETLERQVRERTAKLTKSFYETVKALGRLTEKRDPYTAGHQNRVALLAMGISRKLGLSQNEIETINVACLLHDIGKIAVPVELLVKPSLLTPPEKNLMRLHPQAGYDIIKDIPFVESLGKDVPHIVLTHHERLDGSGYPKGLTENQLTPESKILCVADVIEAMSCHRPYRPALDMTATKEEISFNKGRLYCPECVDACLQLIESNGNDAKLLFDALSRAAQKF